MSKLSLDALKNRAEAIASEELMSSITGGNTNGCHCVSSPGTGSISQSLSKFFSTLAGFLFSGYSNSQHGMH